MSAARTLLPSARCVAFAPAFRALSTKRLHSDRLPQKVSTKGSLDVERARLAEPTRTATAAQHRRGFATAAAARLGAPARSFATSAFLGARSDRLRPRSPQPAAARAAASDKAAATEAKPQQRGHVTAGTVRTTAPARTFFTSSAVLARSDRPPRKTLPAQTVDSSERQRLDEAAINAARNARAASEASAVASGPSAAVALASSAARVLGRPFSTGTALAARSETQDSPSPEAPQANHDDKCKHGNKAEAEAVVRRMRKFLSMRA